MDSSFDDTVVDLLSGGGGEGRIKMTSSFVLSFFGEILGITFGMNGN